MIPQRRCLVTGAHGFIGRYTARCFHQAGYTVDGIGHGSWDARGYGEWGIATWHAADITIDSLRRLPFTPEVIVHCAGAGSVGAAHQDPLKEFDRAVASTAHVLEYLRTCAPDARLVFPSSASVYGNCAVSPIPEHAPLAPVSQYGTLKLVCEQLIQSSARSFGTPAVIVRLFSAYGPGLRKQLLWDACRKLSQGDNQFMGTGDEVRDWIHGEDAASLLLCAARHAGQAYLVVNGGCGQGVTTREVLEHVADCLPGSPASIRFSHAQRVGDPSAYIACTRGVRQLPWQPRHDWKSGVAAYVHWWMNDLAVPQVSQVVPQPPAGSPEPVAL